ncbi:hypothetical protein HYR99_25070 [Candidatus Poribacteria bacterium]|nr:hypothetical protein [Candidatus Poribacteria bacterium]
MRLILSKQYKKHVKIGKILALPCLLFHLSSLAWGAPVPDFAISPADVQFSPNHPVEGQSVIITADVLNKGGETQADIDVRFFEGAVDNSGLQIGKGAVIVGLRSGEKGKVEAKWRARTGPVNIYVVVDPDNAIAEVDETNNQAIRVITGQALDLPKATPAQIEAAIQKGIKWLRTQQGEFIVLCPDGHGNPAFMEFCMICRKPLKGGKVEKLDDERTRGGWNPIIGPGGTALAGCGGRYRLFTRQSPHSRLESVGGFLRLCCCNSGTHRDGG